jgi:nitroimidazol reductase NimA-like FMN-containing flavoprotein (pyridoxamine 5'-phosphate oxidase superfamily)
MQDKQDKVIALVEELGDTLTKELRTITLRCADEFAARAFSSSVVGDEAYRSIVIYGTAQLISALCRRQDLHLCTVVEAVHQLAHAIAQKADEQKAQEQKVVH